MSKKLYAMFCAGLLACTTSYAQNIFPQTGNAGIGTQSPIANLDIYSTANTQTSALISIRSNFHTAGNYGMIRFGDYTQTNLFQKGALIYEGVSSAARGKFHIALENTDGVGSVSLADAKLTVLSNGSTGFGTQSPKSFMEVRKDALSAQGPVLELTNGGSYEGASSEIYFSTYNRDTANPSARIKVADNGDWGGDMYFDTKGTDGNAPLYTRMFIDGASGNVGIGTTNPYTHKLAVAGSVIATEVTVKLQSEWPDYVFKPSYRLKPLSEIQAYINRNQHLPDMPSEAAVAKDGVNLGEIVKLQTKKIEELTLYLIEQNKEIKKLSKQNSDIRKQLFTIKKSKVKK